MNPNVQLKQTIPVFLASFLLACIGLLPQMQAVVPPPDGGYPDFTTAEGTKALQNLTTGPQTQQLAGFRSLLIAPAASTLVSAVEH